MSHTKPEANYFVQGGVGLTEEDAKAYFSRFGKVRHVKFPQRRPGVNHNFFFVNYEEPTTRVLSQPSHVINGRVVHIEAQRSENHAGGGAGRSRDDFAMKRRRDDDRYPSGPRYPPHPNSHSHSHHHHHQQQQQQHAPPPPPPPPSSSSSHPPAHHHTQQSTAAYHHPGGDSNDTTATATPPGAPPAPANTANLTPLPSPAAPASGSVAEVLVGIPFKICPVEYVQDPRVVLISYNRTQGTAAPLNK